MGYTTKFNGHVSISPSLSREGYAKVKTLEYLGGDPRKGQPDSYCQWVLCEDEDGRDAIQWDGNEKFYEWKEWMEYICKILGKDGYVLNGRIAFQGEEVDDLGTLVVKDNVVFIETKETLEGKLKRVTQILREAPKSPQVTQALKLLSEIK